MATYQTPLYDSHTEEGASMDEYGQWDLPAVFTDHETEHATVRDAVGKFDASFMRALEFSDDAVEFVDSLVTRSVPSLDAGDAVYTCVLDAEGTLLDDGILYHLPAGADSQYKYIPNPAAEEIVHDHVRTLRDERDEAVSITHVTDQGMIAIQGPDSPATITDEIDGGVDDLDRLRGLADAVV